MPVIDIHQHLGPSDRIHIEAFDQSGHSVFGATRTEVVAPAARAVA
jgi:hypothetical protein